MYLTNCDDQVTQNTCLSLSNGCNYYLYLFHIIDIFIVVSLKIINLHVHAAGSQMLVRYIP
jgi:hypothetical protein